jgi:ribonuclease BN (tRNA processing enzyme)
VARAAGAKRLPLSHINANYDDEKSIGLAGIRAIFPKAELAHDKMEVEF